MTNYEKYQGIFVKNYKSVVSKAKQRGAIQMKDNTILVVVCVNNEELFEQCERQIRNIFVPPGYVVQIFPI